MSVFDLNEELLSSGATWQAEENPISRMNDWERRQLLGAIVPEKSRGLEARAEVVRPAAGLPGQIDWRNYKGMNVTSVKNQGGCGSCVAFGSLSVLESMISIEKSMLLNLSEADFFFCSSHGPVCTGWWPQSAYVANQTRGVCQEVLFPYASAFPGGNIYASPPSCVVNPKRGSNAFSYANIHTVNSITATKNYLYTTGPITACFTVYSDFYHYRSGIYKHVSGGVEGAHCIAIVGYCDDNSAAGGYWICKNSWGADWGMGGYFFIAYGQCDIDTNAKIGVSGVKLPSTIYASIQSAAFRNVALRMDGSAVKAFSGTGGGLVNCQYTAMTWEHFSLNLQSGGTYTIGSMQFPNVFLRMDGSNVRQPLGQGSGVVNCQYTARTWEQFTLNQQAGGTYTIGSAQFPNVFLRMDGSGVTSPTGSGGGKVNCQYTASTWEHFMIRDVML